MNINKKMDLYISALSFREEDVRDKTAVVIDVMRASSTIVTAIHNGSKGVIPVENMEMAGKISQNLDSSQYLLCGEKNGTKIEGYHLGNSPLEYTTDVVANKTIILNTTNGTKAIKRATKAEQIIIGSFLNLKQTVRQLKAVDHPIALVCAGWHGRLSLEDLLCAGNIIYELNGGELPDKAHDSVKIAHDLFKKRGADIKKTITASDHARRLQGMIDPKDIEHCCSVNKMNTVPVLTDGIITDINGEEKNFQNQRTFESPET